MKTFWDAKTVFWPRFHQRKKLGLKVKLLTLANFFMAKNHNCHFLATNYVQIFQDYVLNTF